LANKGGEKERINQTEKPMNNLEKIMYSLANVCIHSLRRKILKMNQVCVIIILILAIFSSGCTDTPKTKPDPSGSNVTVSPVTTGSSSPCGITSCHGMDIHCGSDVPDVCTAEYQPGDKCRQYAKCSDEGGTCRMIPSQTFDSCKSCVEQCLTQYGQNYTAVTDCERKC